MSFARDPFLFLMLLFVFLLFFAFVFCFLLFRNIWSKVYLLFLEFLGMMRSISNIIVIISMVMVIPFVTCELCKTGVVKDDYKICSDQCIWNTTCSCEAQQGTGIEHCKQYCTYFTHVCSSMTCRGGLSCSQYCGKARCNMTCENNAGICRQNCPSPGKCDIIKCSSATCDQRCANCQMICTNEVENCKQTCLGGSCELKCAAKNCLNECKINGTRCEVDESGKTSRGDYVDLSITLAILVVMAGSLLRY